MHGFTILLILQDIRQRVEESLPGTAGGRNSQDELLVKVLFLLPFLGLIFLYHHSFLLVGLLICVFLDHKLKMLLDLRTTKLVCRPSNFLGRFVDLHCVTV